MITGSVWPKCSTAQFSVFPPKVISRAKQCSGVHFWTWFPWFSTIFKFCLNLKSTMPLYLMCYRQIISHRCMYRDHRKFRTLLPLVLCFCHPEITFLWQSVPLCTWPPALKYKVFGPELCMVYHVIYICYSIVFVGPQDKVTKLLEGHTREDEIYSMVLLQSARHLAGSWEH